ncbi:MAG: DUF3857 domain-containing protein [Dokdonella sp.]
MPFKSLACALLGLSWLCALVRPALAETDGAPDLASRIGHYDVSFTIKPDGSFIEEREWSLAILKERAVSDAKQASISYSTSIQKADVKAAYTLKADGRRIDAPKSNFQIETNRGQDSHAPVFSDLTTLTVVFPEVAVGDTVVLAYRLTATQPMFPGQFSDRETFWRTQAYDSIDVKIDAPESLAAQYEAPQMKEVRNVVENGRRLIEWTFENKQPQKAKRKDYSVIDIEQEPGFVFSTFKTYDDIARAYGVGASPRAVVTDRVRKLADEIVGKQESPREVARLLYEWVAINLSFAGNCVGLGAVVPHETGFVLDNRMGDCKDHATLLQALLAAKGIASTQALINSGSTYRLPKIPVASVVNHVIVYIPSLDVYADATSSSTPFGMLPFSDADKPVLLVDGGKAGARTPASPVGVNQQHMKTVVRVQPDGSVQGEAEVALKGSYALYARSSFRDMSREYEDELMKNFFQSQGYIGSGTLQRDDAKALTDSYSYNAKFDIKDMVRMHGPGAISVEPIFFSQKPISHFTGIAVADIETDHDTTCTSGSSIEEYRYEFPKNMKILATPDDIKLSEGLRSYIATYKFKGNTLTVRREFDDRTPGNVCSPEVERAEKDFAQKVAPDLKSQVVYK